MIKKRCFFIISAVFAIAHVTTIVKASSKGRESEWGLFAAGVLPIVVNNVGEKKSTFAILGKEIAHGYEGQGEWSDFSGGNDPREDKGNSFYTALREARQEARLKYVWKDFNVAHGIENHILKNIQSCVIFAFQDQENTHIRQYGVMYLSDIKVQYKQQLFDNFKSAKSEITAQKMTQSERKALLEKSELLQCYYEELLEYANQKRPDFSFVQLTSYLPEAKASFNSAIKLRSTFIELLQSIKEENKVEFKFPVPMYVNSKKAIFDPQLGCYRYEDGFVLSAEEKQFLCSKVMEDLLSAEHKFEIIPPAKNKLLSNVSGWKSYRNLLFLLMIVGSGIGGLIYFYR